MLEVQLYHGDCLEVMKLIPDHSVDMILCDLPYGVTKCAWDKPVAFDPLWEQYTRVIKDHGAIVLFSTQPFTTDLINSNRKLFKYEIVWEKTLKSGALNCRKMPLKGHENILIFYKHLPVYNPQMRTVERKDLGRVRNKKADRFAQYGHVNAQDYVETGQRYPHDVIHFSNWNGALFGNNKNATKHPTQKPVPLLEYLIRTYTNMGGRVMDNCMGSGSTGVACVNTEREFIGIELDETFYRIACERIDKAMSQKYEVEL